MNGSKYESRLVKREKFMNRSLALAVIVVIAALLPKSMSLGPRATRATEVSYLERCSVGAA